MKKIISLLMLLSALNVEAQKVEISVAGNWVEIPVQQTQSELKPGWKTEKRHPQQTAGTGHPAPAVLFALPFPGKPWYNNLYAFAHDP